MNQVDVGELVRFYSNSRILFGIIVDFYPIDSGHRYVYTIASGGREYHIGENFVDDRCKLCAAIMELLKL